VATPQAGAQTQSCPNCGTAVDITGKEPLAEINCPKCGTKLCVECSFDNFALVELLGTGGMGAVYKAQDTRLGRFVALKVLRKELAAEPGAAEKLQQEARITASINHPNVVQIFSSGIAHDQFYLVMELVDKWSFDELMEVQHRIPEKQTLDVGLQVARGLQAAQRVGLIHRDIKPGNILFSDAQTAKIVDFGLAVLAEQKAESTGEIWGTPYYVAPERLDNALEDFRSDIYSLGATLFHAISGKPPIEGETDSAVALKELKKNAVRLSEVAPDVSPATIAAIERMLEVDPKDRYGSYEELIDDLERAQKALILREAGETQPKRSLAVPIVIGLVVLGLLGGGAVWWFRSHSAQTAPVQTQTPQTKPTPTQDLQAQFDQVRHQHLIAGRYDAARDAFSSLATKAAGQQPLLNWIRMHLGLTALLDGRSAAARQAFQQVAQSDPKEFKKGDAALAQWFSKTAARLIAGPPIPEADTKDYEANSVSAFSIFLFGLANWEQGAFADAVPLLQKFDHAEPPPEFRWITEYKPIGRKYLDEYATYTRWFDERKNASTTEQLDSARTALRRLKIKGALGKQLKTEEQKLTAELAERRKAEEAREAEQRQITEKETPAWNAALANFRKNVSAYKFPEALAAATSVQLTSEALKQQQNVTLRKGQWLIDWKNKLIENLNRTAYGATITDVRGTPYTGSVGASLNRLKLRTPYGTVEVEWTLLAPTTLLSISKSFIKPNVADTADRQWLCAIFALETGQVPAARELAQAAAAGKPEYQQQLAAVFPAGDGK
jgi:serine/threonine protein kinase